MDSPRSMSKVAMTYGAVYGLLVIALMLLFYFMGMNYESRIPSYASYVVQIVVIVMAIKSYRDLDQGGFIRYGKAVGLGVLTSIFGGILVAGFTILLMYYIAPEMIDNIIAKAQEEMERRGGMTEEQMQMGLSYTRKFMQPLPLFFFALLSSAFFGFIFSLIISVFVKRDNPNPFANADTNA